MSFMQIPLVSHWLSNTQMLIDDLRRTNLARLAKESGGVGRLAEKLERDQSQVSQWLNGSKNSSTGTPRGIRATTCRFIEEKTGKEAGWLDIDHSSRAKDEGWPFKSIRQERIAALDPGQMDKLEAGMLAVLSVIEEPGDGGKSQAAG